MQLVKTLTIRSTIGLWIISWFVVAFGQPAWLPMLSPAASFVGYALFFLTFLYWEDKKTRFLSAFIWFSAVQSIYLSWLTATAYQGLYILAVYAMMVIFFGLQFGALSLVFPKKLNEITFFQVIAISAFWVLIEWSRLFFLCGFALSFSGIALTSYLVTMQLASVCGILGLSFFVMTINLFSLKAFIQERKSNYFITLFFIFFIYTFGGVHLFFHQHQLTKSKNCHAVLVQPGLTPGQKHFLPGKESEYVSPLTQWESIIAFLSQSPQGNLDLIVLPEGVVSYGAYNAIYPKEEVYHILKKYWGRDGALTILKDFPLDYLSNTTWAHAIATHYQCDVVAGFDDIDLADNHLYNAAFYFEPNTQHPSFRYEKKILVPGGEYLPALIPQSLLAKYGSFHFFTPGPGAKVWGKSLKISPSICYEECFGDFIRDGRKLDAELFVNLTNDNWFYGSRLPMQHFYYARLRAVENGVPLLRACNTGISAAIDSLGKIHTDLKEPEGSIESFSGALLVDLPLYRYNTIYTLCGDRLIVSLCISILIAFGMKIMTCLKKGGGVPFFTYFK